MSKKKSLDSFYITKRRQEKNKGGGRFYKSDYDIVCSYKLKNIFNSREEKSNAYVHEMCKWMVKNKKSPSKQSKDPVESKFGNFLGDKKKARKNKGGCTFYKSDQKIAESYGFKKIYSIYMHVESKSNEKSKGSVFMDKENKRRPKYKRDDKVEANMR